MEKNLFHNLKAIVFRYRWKFLQGFLMVFISNGLLIVNPLVFRQAVQAISSSPPESLWHARLIQLLGVQYSTSIWFWASLLLLIALIAAFFKYWMRMTFITVSRKVEVDVRGKLFCRIQDQSMAFFDRYGIGELLSRLTNDISAYRDVLGPGIMYPLFFLTLVIPGLVALFSISPPLAVISFIPMVSIPLLNAAIRGPMYQLSLHVQQTLGKLSNMVQEHFSFIRIIKSYVIENALWKRFTVLSFALMRLNLRLSWFQGSIFPTFTFITKIVTILLVMFSGIIILRPWGKLSTADFISFMWIQSYIFFPVIMLGWLLPLYERGRAAYKRLVEIYQEPIEVTDTSFSRLQIPDGASIVFRNLTFSYPAVEAPTLSHLNLEIKGGSFVGLTGPVGAGKTTIIRLLNREYEIPKGMIFIDGRDIHEYPLTAFHTQIATVEQAPFLFSKSILENVRFGRREATAQELELVARYADFHDTVITFPDQYATLVGERGVTLSGGQKQRLAIARAFLTNRSILLLDDVFSAVDSVTEKRIFTTMQENLKGKTVLFVTHRVSLLEQMDRVIYLADGRILEEGTPSHLLASKGHYAALVELQKSAII